MVSDDQLQEDPLFGKDKQCPFGVWSFVSWSVRRKDRLAMVHEQEERIVPAVFARVEEKQMTTLGQAKAAFFEDARRQGAKCPCCGRFGKVYKRKLHSSMVAVLVLLYRFQSLGFTHVHTLINATTSPAVASSIRGDFAKLRYWGLIEEGFESKGGKQVSSGKWRITGKGAQFVENAITVPRYVWIYNSDALGFHGEQISVYDALGEKFSYRELMGNS